MVPSGQFESKNIYTLVKEYNWALHLSHKPKGSRWCTYVEGELHAANVCNIMYKDFSAGMGS